MLQIATFVANDPRVQQAFLKGKMAVESEGGGKGQKQAQVARDELLTIVAPSWAEMTKQFKARQLHFHLGPGSTSFLRVHKPTKFGDNMDNVRYTIVDANNGLSATSGFETGRVYSGIRGVQPVFALSSDPNKKIHVGAVESGISYHDLLQNLSQTFDINIAVLLTMEHIKANVWPDFLNKRFKKSPPFGDLVVEETSSAEYKDILGPSAILQPDFSSNSIKTVLWDKKYFVLSEMPLRDYRGTTDATLDNVGKIVFWKDITHAYTSFISDFKSNLIYAAIAYLFVELLLFLGIGKTTKSLNLKIRQRTQDLQLYEKIFNDTNEGINITDAKSNIISVNPAFCEITGYSQEEIIGKNPRILGSGRQSPQFYSAMWETINEEGHWQGEVWNRKKDGSLFAELLSVSAILENGKITNYVGIFSDITQIKKQQQTLEKMAHYDVLTQLPNRVLLSDRFHQAVAHNKRQQTMLAVCFLDLDDFKPVNDLYGHETGDKLLIDVAQRIKSNIRDEDTLSRLGGDEFILLLSNIESMSLCEKRLKRVLESVSSPYVIDEQMISISASIGVSSYPVDSSDLDTLMRHADQAMYIAKSQGRNRYSLFNKEKNQVDIQRIAKFKEIQNAFENNEFCLYYQPKVNMATGKVFGAEALIRWIHPDKGLIPPLEFLPIINATALEVQVGTWVINEALKQLDKWKEQGIELNISVNVSSYHLQSSVFVAELEKILSMYPKVYSKCLQLEILESSALGDLELISVIIKTCIDTLGVDIALDDFGTGYSSLTHLRNLSVNTVKIDQTFVRDLLDDPNDYAIIESVIGLTNAFNRNVIAEGVETTEHGLMLLLMGCNEAQGYAIARPMPSHDIPNWLSHYTPNNAWTSYAKKAYTEKENAIKIFRITITQWQKDFETNIHALPGETRRWPILKRTKCHCGIWIHRVRQEKLFEEKWLKKLELAHDVMHDIADNLFAKYKEGKIDAARDELHTFQKAAEDMLNIIKLCK